MKNLDLHKALVVGLGYRTGLSVSNFLSRRGVDITVSDNKSADDLAGITERLNSGIRLIAGSQSPELLDEGFDVVILSPGVPRSIPLISEACSRGIPVISEVELAYSFLKGKIVAITGTDGKSTTTSLVGHIFNTLQMDIYVGGNIGTPLISFAENTNDNSITAAELSSFQLETIADFRPDASAILNIAPDHMDRYDGMDDYVEAKFRIAENQDESDFFIYNLDDAIISSRTENIRARKLSFSLSNSEADIYYRNGSLILKSNESELDILSIDKMKILGLHNAQNAMAAILLTIAVLEKKGISPDFKAMADAVYSFPGLEHRLEQIGIYEGRTFINDSKATTVGAVLTAVQSLQAPAVLIIGGRTKGDDYSRLARAIKGKIKALVLIGESQDEFRKVFSGYSSRSAASLEDAVGEAMKLSDQGDTVLLSPACASFDMFESYEHRGETFKKAFMKLKSGELSWT